MGDDSFRPCVNDNKQDGVVCCLFVCCLKVRSENNILFKEKMGLVTFCVPCLGSKKGHFLLKQYGVVTPYFHTTNFDVNNWTEQDISDRAQNRKELRLKHPGFGFLNLEVLFEIVMEHVVVWDMRRNRAIDVP